MKTIICKLSETRGGFRCWTGPSGQIAMLAMLLWLPTTGAETMTIPNGAETRENIRNFAVPISVPGDVRAQQIYSPSLFPVILGPGQFFQLEAIAFRLSSQGPDPRTSSATFDRLEILLSTGNGPFTTSLDQNHGQNVLAVYDSTATLAGSVPPGTTPATFDLQISFGTPFLYDPSQGALVLEIRKSGSGGLSAVAGSDIPGVIYYSETLFGVETGNNIGLETQFTYQVVPEPPVGSLAILGMLVVLAARKMEN